MQGLDCRRFLTSPDDQVSVRIKRMANLFCQWYDFLIPNFQIKKKMIVEARIFQENSRTQAFVFFVFFFPSKSFLLSRNHNRAPEKRAGFPYRESSTSCFPVRRGDNRGCSKAANTQQHTGQGWSLLSSTLDSRSHSLSSGSFDNSPYPVLTRNQRFPNVPCWERVRNPSSPCCSPVPSAWGSPMCTVAWPLSVLHTHSQPGSPPTLKWGCPPLLSCPCHQLFGGVYCSVGLPFNLCKKEQNDKCFLLSAQKWLAQGNAGGGLQSLQCQRFSPARPPMSIGFPLSSPLLFSSLLSSSLLLFSSSPRCPCAVGDLDRDLCYHRCYKFHPPPEAEETMQQNSRGRDGWG